MIITSIIVRLPVLDKATSIASLDLWLDVLKGCVLYINYDKNIRASIIKMQIYARSVKIVTFSTVNSNLTRLVFFSCKLTMEVCIVKTTCKCTTQKKVKMK